jgi:ApaG protein
MGQQAQLLKERYSEVTEGIRVSVVPQELVDESNPSDQRFVFAYTVKIENEGSESVQLLERHWRIYAGGRQYGEVVGPGVVGEQPVLEPGESFQYVSSAVIDDPIGSMLGEYTFRAATGRFFKVTIPKFDLLYPLIIH